jgi:hypothetical protein
MSKGTTLRQAVREGRAAGLYRVEVNRRNISIVAAGAGIGFGTLVLDDLPKGNVKLDMAAGAFGFEKQDANIIATWSGGWSIGTAPTAAGALTTTESDILNASGGLAIGPAVSGNIPGTRQFKSPTGMPVDNTAGALEINLNMFVAAASITDATTGVIKVTGWLDLIMSFVGA